MARIYNGHTIYISVYSLLLWPPMASITPHQEPPGRKESDAAAAVEKEGVDKQNRMGDGSSRVCHGARHAFDYPVYTRPKTY